MNVALIRDAAGQIQHLLFAMRDISDRKQTEFALRENEQKFRGLFERMAQGVVYQDADGQIISANIRPRRSLHELALTRRNEATRISCRKDGMSLSFESILPAHNPYSVTTAIG